MDGNPLGMSLDDESGGYYIGVNGSHGPMDPEFMMGQHIYMHGDMGEKREPEPWEDPAPGWGTPEPDEYGGGDDFGPDF